MSNEELKKDLENFLEKKLEPINLQNIEREKERHQTFMDRHSEKSEKLAEKHSNSITQLITLEGVILTAIVVFGKPEEATVWLIRGIVLILVSLIFGIWLQTIGTQADLQSWEWEYQQELNSHWWRRELWKDSTVKYEKAMIEPHLKEGEEEYKEKINYKIMKLFNLNYDRIENIFKITFLVSLLFLIIHFINIPFKNSANTYEKLYPAGRGIIRTNIYK